MRMFKRNTPIRSRARKVQRVAQCAQKNAFQNKGHNGRQDIFHGEEGFSTIGMVLALLITLSLIFSSAQVYQIESASAEVQNIADAAALAAENEVAEFYIVVRLCDALILSLSLTSIAALGLGVAALCTPATAALSEGLLKAADKINDARNNFAEKAADGLNRMQSALPFLSAVNAASVIAENSGGALDSGYFGFALLLPFEGKPITVGVDGASKELLEDIDQKKNEVKDVAYQAEEAAQEAKEAKKEAFLHDCGNNPSYCMYERAASLSDLTAKENPLYHSVDTWNFGVAMKRAQAYYTARLLRESPEDDSVGSQARSALRKKFYSYAAQEMKKGYVHEDVTGLFDAHFPHLPKNTIEMQSTDLYTEAAYPITVASDGAPFVMHAWSGCPGANGATSAGVGSIAQMDAGGFTTCTVCEFSAASLGKVAAASTSIENGFEYHYEKVAAAADAYQKAKEKGKPAVDKAKNLVDTLLSGLNDLLNSAGSYRIEAHPPGRFGSVAFAASITKSSPANSLLTSFVKGNTVLGTRVAVSSAALVSDTPKEAESVIASLLDGVLGKASNNALGSLDVVLDLWSSVLFAYTQGEAALSKGIESALSGIPLASESGLGTWAVSRFDKIVKDVGLEPAPLDAPKPVLVNTAHVLAADDSAFAQKFFEAKKQAVSAGVAVSGDFFTCIVSQLEKEALARVEGLTDEITIATIEPFGSEGPSIPITIALPPSVKSAATGVVQDAADSISALHEETIEGRLWE